MAPDNELDERFILNPRSGEYDCGMGIAGELSAWLDPIPRSGDSIDPEDLSKSLTDVCAMRPESERLNPPRVGSSVVRFDKVSFGERLMCA